MLLILALCHLWAESHASGGLQRWIKVLQAIVVALERVLALMLIAIAVTLQFTSGVLNTLIKRSDSLFAQAQPNWLDPGVLGILALLGILGIALVVRLRTERKTLGRAERWVIILASFCCLVLIGENTSFASLPLLATQIQLAGNFPHWSVNQLNLFFFPALIIPSLLALLWLRRTFFRYYRRLFHLIFYLTLCCAILQLIWPLFLPLGLIVFTASILLVIQVEKVG